jgi:soluble lytic murein transglycosylase-like protein
MVALLCSAVATPGLANSAGNQAKGEAPVEAIQTIDGTQSQGAPFILYEHQVSKPFSDVQRQGSSLPPAQPSPASSSRRPEGAYCSALDQPPRRSSLTSRTHIGRTLYWPLVRAAECRYRLPFGLLDSLIIQESRYQPSAVSHAGAAGLAQLMPGTARGLGVTNSFDPLLNVEGGARYLRQMLDSFAGSIPLALAAYNAGPGSVRKARGIPRNGETPNYVQRVLGYWSEAPFAGDAPTAVSAVRTAVVLSF